MKFNLNKSSHIQSPYLELSNIVCRAHNYKRYYKMIQRAYDRPFLKLSIIKESISLCYYEF